MPVTIRRVKKDCYEVRTPNGVHAKCATMKDAIAQKHLLQGVEHGWEPTGKPVRKPLNMRKTVRITPAKPRIGR